MPGKTWKCVEGTKCMVMVHKERGDCYHKVSHTWSSSCGERCSRFVDIGVACFNTPAMGEASRLLNKER